MAADKRSLYHLAPTQTPSPQFRKPLVQGRLETSPMQGSLFLEKESITKGYDPAEHKPRVTPTKLEEQRPQISTQKPSTEQEPRLLAPAQYKEPSQGRLLTSPPAVEPSSSLSLSENDDSSEPVKVPVVTNTTTSPVKVVCHSPRRSKTRGQEGAGGEEVRGFADQAAKVDVPGITKFSVRHTEDERRHLVTNDGSLSEDSLDSIKMIAGSPIDPNSSAVRVAVDDHDKENAAGLPPYNPDQYKSFMGDEQVPHTGPLSAALNQSNVRQQLFDFSVASADLSTMETSAAGNQSVSDDKKKKKKKAGRIIPSRYMDSKKASTKKSTQNRRQVSFNHPSRDYSSQNNSTQLNTTAPYQHNTSLKGSKIVTSTPAVGSIGVLPGHPGGDMTVPTPILAPGQTVARGVSPHVKGRGVSPHIKGVSRTTERAGKDEEKTKKPAKIKAPLLPQKQFDNLTKHKGQEIGEVSQQQLELEYARLMQWAFLESKLKSTFQRQQKDAQAQLYSMWKTNEKLRQEISQLELELDVKNHCSEVDEQINLQLTGLKSIGSNLAKQILHYDQLSSALNTTCQQLPVDDVIVDNQEELLMALSESERLLGEIDGLTRHRNLKISNFSKEMNVLSKVTKDEVEEQSSCQELLAAASTLSTQERSLQAHSITAKGNVDDLTIPLTKTVL